MEKPDSWRRIAVVIPLIPAPRMAICLAGIVKKDTMVVGDLQLVVSHLVFLVHSKQTATLSAIGIMETQNRFCYILHHLK